MSGSTTESSPHRRRSSQAQGQAKDEDLNETTPLLLSRTRSQDNAGVENVAVQIPPDIVSVDSSREQEQEDIAPQWAPAVRYWVFVCAFVVSFSFGVTQVPYVSTLPVKREWKVF